MRCLAGRKPQHAHQLQSEEQSNHHHVLDRVLCHPYQTKELLDAPRSSLLKFAPVTVSCKLKENKILTSVARYKASHHSRRVFRQHQRLLFAKDDHLMTGRRVFSGRPNLVNRHNRVGLVLRKQMVWKYEIDDVFSMVVET
jgi:hypothetical protein